MQLMSSILKVINESVRCSHGRNDDSWKSGQTAVPLRGIAAAADIVPALRHNSLISTSKLADEGYHTVFMPDAVLVYDGKVIVHKTPIWTGWQDIATGLWQVPLIPEVQNLNTDTALLNADDMKQAFEERILHLHNLPSKDEHIRYLYAAPDFLTKETRLAATRAGYLTSWPGVTINTINKYFPESVETQKGHTKHQRKGLHSTKVPVLQSEVTDKEAASAEMQLKELRQKQRDIYIRVYDDKVIVYTNQTGKFPTISSRGYKYLMVMYYIDGSTILMKPMKSRTETEMIRAHEVLIQRLKACGFNPAKQMLDNEISKDKKAIESHNMTVERVPKEAHRRNAAEEAIQIAMCNPNPSLLAAIKSSSEGEKANLELISLKFWT